MALYNYSGFVAPRLSFAQSLVSIDSVHFVFWVCSLQALLHTMRLVTRLQHQFTRSW